MSALLLSIAQPFLEELDLLKTQRSMDHSLLKDTNLIQDQDITTSSQEGLMEEDPHMANNSSL